MKANIRWLDDPETFRVNQIAAHSDHLYFKNYEEWEQKRAINCNKLSTFKTT